MVLATQDRASSVQGVCLRVSRLNAAGTIPTGVDSTYVMDRFVDAHYTPTLGGGTSIELQGANGNMIVNYTTKDVLQRAEITVNIADPDPQFKEILVGGTVFIDNTVPASPVAVGWAPALPGTVSNPNGSALEVWSNAISGGRRAATLSFLRYVFPRTFLDPTGDHAFENGVMGQGFSGFGQENPGFGAGPDSTAGNAWLWTSDRPYQHARVASAPTGINNYVAV